MTPEQEQAVRELRKALDALDISCGSIEAGKVTGPSESVISLLDQAQRERDELAAKLAEVEASARAFEKLSRENGVLRDRLAAAEAACAEMRGCLEDVDIVPEKLSKKIDHALANDCGKSILDQLSRLKKVVRSSIEIAKRNGEHTNWKVFEDYARQAFKK